MKSNHVKTRAAKVLAILKQTYADATCELVHEDTLQLLIATILSAQCTDKRVNMVTPALFKKYKTAKEFARADLTELESFIHSTGFYKNKAKSIKHCCVMLVEKHAGKVPHAMEELTDFPGVGRKTAHVIRGYGFKEPAMVVDTHVLRVAKRLGFSQQENAVKMEHELAALVPEKDWTDFCTTILFHGRYCCKARKPECHRCPLKTLCPS